MTKNTNNQIDTRQIELILNHFEELRPEWERANRDIPHKYQGVILACSGGVDSIGLFEVLRHFFFAKKNSFFQVFHFNYGLRGEASDGDERFVSQLCREAGVTCHVRKPPNPAPKKGIQTWARELRYAAFEDYIKRGYLIALAHQLDDVAENTLFRLARGSQMGNAAGMSKFSPPYWRPFLLTNRTKIEDYLKIRNIPHREDQSNAKLEYSRNRIRHIVLPELESQFSGAASRIAKSALATQEVMSWLSKSLIESYYKRPGTIKHWLGDFPEAVGKEAIMQVVRDITKNSAPAQTQALVGEIYDCALLGEVKSFDLSSGGRLHIDKYKITYDETQERDNRFSQNAASIFGEDIDFILAPGTSVRLEIGEQRIELGLSDQQSLGPRHLRAYTPRSSERVRFFGKSWKLKELMQSWDIAPNQRQKTLLLTIDNEPLGFLIDNNFIVPSKSGAMEKGHSTAISLRFLHGDDYGKSS